MAESTMENKLKPCGTCGAPVREIRVRSSVQVIAGPTVYVANRVCTNPECGSKKLVRAITDVV